MQQRRLFDLRRQAPTPIYRAQLNYEVIEDGCAIGRIYQDLHVELRWLWLIWFCWGSS